MANNADASASETIKVGEVIKLGGNANADNGSAQSPGPNDAGNGGDNAGTGQDSAEGSGGAIDFPSRRRKRVGARASELASKLLAGTATDDEKREARDNARPKAPRQPEAPPKVDSDKTDGPSAKRDRGWRSKYGDHDGRELLCRTLAGYLDAGCCALSDYIVENGGKPLINLSGKQTRERLDKDGNGTGQFYEGPTDAQIGFANLLVLAVDDVLPPELTAAPHLIAGVSAGTLLVQGAWTARKVSIAKHPAKPISAVESEVERARKARDANPPKEQATSNPPKTSEGLPKDKEGVPTV